ncbi:DUF4974 domain-containing protein [Rhodocytophaga rosea]|uniref:DUF4974 domain-containing protein n=1 Tax=Rhodocytophaga rosea TaxID=2704465 RepID=A0A6C0GIZ6_9BACT|nr:FecR domain-containing protein [Rhodocytophaga rosea]QHT67642.1 DUF4974 domain-containing protein [Rhodocytophaga rosea]
MNDELLTKFMLGETTQEENKVIQQWIQADKAHEKHFADFQLIWETSKKLAFQSKANEEEAWQRFKNKRSQHTTKEAQVKPLISRFILMRVAAVFVIAFLGWAGYWGYQSTQNPSALMSIQTGEETRTETLPDGSVVTLNKHSTLTYPKAFQGNTRELNLQTGEAFFDVIPDKNKPFVVQVNNVQVKVLGTSFNIKAAAETTEVIVETGRVEVSRNNRIALLKPQEKVLVKENVADFTKENNPDKLYTYYRNKEFIANDTPLWRMVDVLNEAYDANIVIEREELRNLKLNTTFKNESLDHILSIISQTFDIKVVKKENKIILR